MSSNTEEEAIAEWMNSLGFTFDEETDLWLDDLSCEYTQRAAKVFYNAFQNHISTLKAEYEESCKLYESAFRRSLDAINDSHKEEIQFREEAMKKKYEEKVREARADEVAMFFQKFEKTEDIGSTPSDLITGEAWIDAEVEDIEQYFDDRLRTLTQPPKEGKR